MIEIKQKILNQLEKEDELPSTVIAGLIREGYWKTLMMLKELEQEKKIKRLEKGKNTYWRLKR